MIIVYTTCKDEAEARMIASALLEEKLIACANLFACRSLYRWRGEARDEPECAMIMKTRAEHWPRVRERIAEMHSYDLPCIERIEAEAGADFERWVRGETAP